jgi:predicted dienelactone hydrolase
MPHARRAVVRLALAAMLVPLVASACAADEEGAPAPPPTTEKVRPSDDGTTATAPATQPSEAEDFTVRGPFAVGVTELDGEPPILVFYPADRDAVASDARLFTYGAEDHWGRFVGVLTDELRAAFAFEFEDAWLETPASEQGQFPLVVYSHGLSVSRFLQSAHSTHLASWGYVVAVPQQSSRDLETAVAAGGDASSLATVNMDVLETTIAEVLAESERSGSFLEGTVSSEKLAVAGHSVGGAEAVLSAYWSDVDTAIALAATAPVANEAAGDHEIVQEGWYGFDPAAGEFDLDAYLTETEPPAKPSLMVVPENDLLFPVHDSRAVFDWLPAPKRLAVLADTGHFLFIDSCERSQDSGGSEALAAALGQDPESLEMRFIENGCSPIDARVADVTALWNHLTVAHLNVVFDVDRASAEASLVSTYLDRRFPGGLAEYVTE